MDVGESKRGEEVQSVDSEPTVHAVASLLCGRDEASEWAELTALSGCGHRTDRAESTQPQSEVHRSWQPQIHRQSSDRRGQSSTLHTPHTTALQTPHHFSLSHPLYWSAPLATLCLGVSFDLINMTTFLTLTSLLLLCLLSIASSSQLTDQLITRRLPLDSLLHPTTPQAPAQVTLDDPPILGETHTPLSGEWTASSPSQRLTMAASVPGDLITDLFRASIIPEPLYEVNWLNASIWNDHTWYYNRSLDLSSAQYDLITAKGGAGDILLVFDGIKMGANILLNNVRIGQALAQFERLVFSLRAIASNSSLSGAVKQGVNALSVEFDHTINTPLFMQCTGGWDWAPYSNTTTADGKEVTFSRGIWKAVYLVASPGGVFLTDIAPLITYNGPFPTQALSDGSHAGFTLNLTLYFTVTDAVSNATLSFLPSWRSTPLTFRLPSLPAGSTQAGVSTLIRVSAGDVNLWWPQGLGEQPLYDLSVRVSAGGRGVVQGSRRVGFRFFAIVTGNDTNPQYVEQNAEADGTDTQGMRFRINGAPIFVRGANVIPMDNNEGRYTAEAHRRMVLSAAQGNMNILRICTHCSTHPVAHEVSL